MSKLRNLIEKLPELGKCIDADRFSARNVSIFDAELAKKESVYGYRESDKRNNRLAVLDIPEEYIGNIEAYLAGRDRIQIAMLSHDKAKGRISKSQEAELQELIATAQGSLEAGVEEELAVEEIYPLEMAVAGIWN